MMNTNEEQIKEIFEQFKHNSVERVKKLKDYAFVHFRERDDALHAMNMINGSLILVYVCFLYVFVVVILFRKRNRWFDRRSYFGQAG